MQPPYYMIVILKTEGEITSVGPVLRARHAQKSMWGDAPEVNTGHILLRGSLPSLLGFSWSQGKCTEADGALPLRESLHSPWGWVLLAWSEFLGAQNLAPLRILHPWQQPPWHSHAAPLYGSSICCFNYVLLQKIVGTHFKGLRKWRGKSLNRSAYHCAEKLLHFVWLCGGLPAAQSHPRMCSATELQPLWPQGNFWLYCRWEFGELHGGGNVFTENECFGLDIQFKIVIIALVLENNFLKDIFVNCCRKETKSRIISAHVFVDYRPFQQCFVPSLVDRYTLIWEKRKEVYSRIGVRGFGMGKGQPMQLLCKSDVFNTCTRT